MRWENIDLNQRNILLSLRSVGNFRLNTFLFLFVLFIFLVILSFFLLFLLFFLPFFLLKKSKFVSATTITILYAIPHLMITVSYHTCIEPYLLFIFSFSINKFHSFIITWPPIQSVFTVVFFLFLILFLLLYAWILQERNFEDMRPLNQGQGTLLIHHCVKQVACAAVPEPRVFPERPRL